MKSKLLELLGSITLFAILLFYSAMIGGLILYKFYYWFVLPVFVSLPKISFASAVGLSFFKSLFYKHDTKKDEKKTDWGLVLTLPLFLLFFGWIAHLILTY